MKKNKKFKNFFVIFLILFILILILLFSIFKILDIKIDLHTSQNDISKTLIIDQNLTSEIENNKNNKTIINNKKSYVNIKKPNIDTNFLIMGLDASKVMADCIMVVHFDSKSQKIDVISVPRDTYIEIDEYKMQKLETKPNPIRYELKLTELHNLSGKKNRTDMVKQEVEKIINQDIDYTVSITLDGFINIIDEIGGIDIEIPNEGIYFYEPTEKFTINLEKGLQHLDGHDALGLARYRSYTDGDIERINMQQNIAKEVFNKVANTETLIKNAPSIAKTCINYVDTDISFFELSKYLVFLTDIKEYSLNTYVIPSSPIKIGNKDYVVIDEYETKQIMESIYNSTELKNKPKLQILNGGNVKGYEVRVKNDLLKKGYDVVDTGNYISLEESYTRIMTKDYDLGNDLSTLFTDAVIRTSIDFDSIYDAIIIVGSGDIKY